ncbi:hypothetical protein FRC11_003583 [Ceratobasidium sp. 423]|nr:hypothetical protein FRC11_003583 [Ceratobasidium sp. 423]
MAPPSGPYNISLPRDQLLTMLEGNNVVGHPLNILPPTGKPVEQTWHLGNGPNDSITLNNIQFPVFVGVQGEPEEGSSVVLVGGPYQLYTEATDDPQLNYIYVERGSGRLYVNVSRLLIEPPQLALSRTREEPWKFQFLE